MTELGSSGNFGIEIPGGDRGRELQLTWSSIAPPTRPSNRTSCLREMRSTRPLRVHASNIGSTHLVGGGGRGSEGQLWQYCHSVEDA
jgi:hypothetical protein